ncbi:MAG: endonuclease/exonuclease/phosphatase family protein [Thermoanaerobaculia bacterium]
MRLKDVSNTHGTFEFYQTHLIHPGESGRYTAKDPKDWSGAFSGSQGNVTFVDEAGCTFRIDYQCSFAKGGNYAFIAEHSPLLDVTLRFANETPPETAGKDWGSASFPANDHPLGILVYIEQRPARESLKVLTYNTHLFKGSNAVIPARAAGVEIVFEDERRGAALLERIEKLDPDVICLQEVWALAEQSALAQKLQKYPHVYLVADNTIKESPWWEQVLSWAVPVLLAGATGGWSLYLLAAQIGAIAGGYSSFSQLLRNVLSNTSGLLFASKVPFRNGSFTMYTGLQGDDALAKKGMIDVTLMLAADSRTPAYVRLGTTHCPTDIGDAQRVIRDEAAPKTLGDANVDRILLGDFNLHVANEREYADLNGTLGKYGAQDVVQRYVPELEHSFTEWQARNTLTWALDARAKNPKEPTRGRDRIDYVYFAPRTRGAYLQPKDVDVPHDWDVSVDNYVAFHRDFNVVSVSDHYPVITTFDVGLAPVSPYEAFSVQTKTALPLSEVTAGDYIFSLAPGARVKDDADLFCVRRKKSGTEKMTVEVLTSASGYSRRPGQTATALSESEAGDYISFHEGRWDDREALFALKKTARGLEIHLLDRANSYKSFLLQRLTKLEGVVNFDDFEFFLGDYMAGGRPDLFCLKRRNTDSKKLEVHVLAGLHEYQRFTLHTATEISLDDVEKKKMRFGVARFNRTAGNSDVYCLESGEEKMRLRILDGTRNFKPMPQTYATALTSADMPNFDFLFGDCAEVSSPGPIYCLKRRNAASGNLEVHILQRRP